MEEPILTEKIMTINDLTKQGWFEKCRELQDQVMRLENEKTGRELKLWKNWLEFERRNLEDKEKQLVEWENDLL